jgi:hypothetical protein
MNMFSVGMNVDVAYLKGFLLSNFLHCCSNPLVAVLILILRMCIFYSKSINIRIKFCRRYPFLTEVVIERKQLRRLTTTYSKSNVSLMSEMYKFCDQMKKAAILCHKVNSAIVTGNMKAFLCGWVTTATNFYASACNNQFTAFQYFSSLL